MNIGIKELLNVVANTPHDTPVRIQVKGSHPLTVASVELKEGVLVIEAEGTPAYPAKTEAPPAGVTKTANSSGALKPSEPVATETSSSGGGELDT
jgi:hypothetical protein